MTTETNNMQTDATSATTETASSSQTVSDQAANSVTTVAKADLDRALKDLHKFKSEARELSTKLKTIEETKLKDQQQWQQLAEIREKEVLEAREEAERIKNSYVSEKKFSAVREAALKAGILPTAISDLELVGLDQVVLETTSTGKLNVIGADAFVNVLKTTKPHWFGANKTTVNSAIPDVSSSKPIDRAQLVKLSLEAQKTGDYTVYQKAMDQYQQQKRN